MVEDLTCKFHSTGVPIPLVAACEHSDVTAYVFRSERRAFLYTGGVSINPGVKKGAPDAKLHYYHWGHRVAFKKQTYDIVQKRFGIGSSTVTLIMKRFKEMGLSIDDLKQMEPRNIERAFYPPENRRDTSIPLYK